jgi:hypothetical protein
MPIPQRAKALLAPPTTRAQTGEKKLCSLQLLHLSFMDHDIARANCSLRVGN